MGDEPYVRLVDAHAERDGRADDEALLAQEPRLVPRTRARVQARVVRHRLDPVATEELGCRLHGLAGQAVDDARVALVLLLEEAEQLLLRVGLADDPVLDVGPVEARHEVLGVRHAEALGDLLVRGVRRRRGQGDARHVGPVLAEHGQRQIVGTEVVAPLRDTVCFVDREEGDLAAGEQSERGVETQPLGRQIEQVELAREELGLHEAALLEVLRRVHEPGAHPERPQRVHLVLHQRDQRRDDDPRTGSDQRRDLVAERFAATGRHEHDGVPTAHHVIDDRFLLAAESVVPEDPVERG